MAKKSKLPTAMPSNGMCKPTREDVERERRYRAEDALRTIQRVDEVRKVMKDVKDYVKEQVKIAGKL